MQHISDIGEIKKFVDQRRERRRLLILKVIVNLMAIATFLQIVL